MTLPLDQEGELLAVDDFGGVDDTAGERATFRLLVKISDLPSGDHSGTALRPSVVTRTLAPVVRSNLQTSPKSLPV